MYKIKSEDILALCKARKKSPIIAVRVEAVQYLADHPGETVQIDEDPALNFSDPEEFKTYFDEWVWQSDGPDLDDESLEDQTGSIKESDFDETE